MMECTPEYANSWLCRRWPRWEAFCVERLGFTAAYLQKSARAKRTAGEERVVSNTWAMATCAAVVIAARWADTLAKGPGENARRILADVFCQPFKEKTTLWAADWGGTGSPEPWQPSGAESVDVVVENGLAKVGPLLAPFPELRKAVEKEVPGSCGPFASLRLADLLICFVSSNTVRSRRAAANLACWIGMSVEMSAMIVEGDTDPLRIPVVIGPKTRRNIDPVLKAGIAKEAAKGKIARSCSKVVASLGRFAGRLSPMAHPQKNAYRLQVETPKAYLNNAIAHYRAADWQFLSLATDGTV